MILVDAHCDTITKLMPDNQDLFKNDFHISLERSKKYKGYVQFFASYIKPGPYYDNPLKRTIQIIDYFYSQIEKHNQHISLCKNINEINNTIQQQKTAAILSIEGGEAIGGGISALRIFYKLGVRSLALTWNYRNQLADGSLDQDSCGGLSKFGMDVVKEMNSLGMLVDVSHISDRGFYDVIEITTSPIIASHSNARAVLDHKRNLSNEQLIKLKENGGVVGINMFPDFLSIEKCSISNVIQHIEHISGLIGPKHIGLGADFDGIDNTPDGIKGIEDIELIFEELLKLNYKEEFVIDFAGGNFLRIIEKVLK